MLDFRNINTLWSSIIVETLYRLGLRDAIICPGSRSSPLTIAFVNHNQIKTIPILDERSAAFFALGMAKKSETPVALVCTSGSAGSNFYPAVIEAKYSGVPLLILTADRPPELLNCKAGQTINQFNLYSNYPNWELQLSCPNIDSKILNYLRQNLIIAYEKSLFPNKGIVHINIPFNEPLAPIIDNNILALKNTFNTNLFFHNVKTVKSEINNLVELPLNLWQKEKKGLIIAGLKNPENALKYCETIAKISQYLNYPVLGEALSPLRNYASLNPNLITNYDFILRNREYREKLAPEIVIQVGELPTSKILREWLDDLNPQRWIIDPICDNFDPLHGQTIHLRTSIEQLCYQLSTLSLGENVEETKDNNYRKNWLTINQKVGKKVNQKLSEIEEIIEGKITWLLGQNLPEKTPLFIANSMPIRYMEYFWQPNDQKITPYFSRGTNGIDGNLSTALGIAYNNKPTVMLTGDLALLHDTNGFLIGQKFKGHLTIILVNNNGGGIFEMLPIADFGSNFEEYFATPQNINFEHLCATYNIEYKLIQSWEHLTALISNLPSEGLRLLEIQTNRKHDAQWLRENLPNFAQF